MRIVDAADGSRLATLELHGRASWSPDSRFVASLDNRDGTVRVAEVATGTTQLVAELGIPAYSFDSCGTSGEVLGWSPDGTAVLVAYTDYSPERFESYVEVMRVDGTERRTLWHRTLPPGDFGAVTARWLANDDVIVAAFDSTTGDTPIVVQRADPWQSWPPPPVELPRPDVPQLYSPSISPQGDRLAFASMGEVGSEGRTAETVGGVITVDIADGAIHMISEHIADSSLEFSPDGTKIAFVDYDFDLGYPDILVVTAADGTSSQIVDGIGGDHVT